MRTIHAVHQGESYVTPQLAARLLTMMKAPPQHAPPAEADMPALTRREEQILRRCAQGLTNEEIGQGLGLSGETVAKFLTNVLLKLHACERYPVLLQAA